MIPLAATPQQARAKRVTRTAIELAGGIEATAAIDGMPGKSQVGRWYSRNERDLPRIDYAAAIDDVAVAEGHEPPFASWFAHQVGRVLVDPPEAEPTRGTLLVQLGDVAAVTGKLHSQFCAALADGKIGDAERAALRALIVAVQTEFSAIDAALSMGEG